MNNLEEFYKGLLDEELDQCYANVAGVDWYKANLIVQEKDRRIADLKLRVQSLESDSIGD
jgi:hypothetical protein